MSKYNITHSCGCEVTHNIVGTNVDGQREKKAEYLATRECTDCYRNTQNAQAACAAKDAGLPDLTGSDKQKAWALSLRAKATKSLFDMRKKLVAVGVESHSQIVADGIAFIDSTLGQTESKYWIDNRDVTYCQVWLSEQVSKGAK